MSKQWSPVVLRPLLFASVCIAGASCGGAKIGQTKDAGGTDSAGGSIGTGENSGTGGGTMGSGGAGGTGGTGGAKGFVGGGGPGGATGSGGAGGIGGATGFGGVGTAGASGLGGAGGISAGCGDKCKVFFPDGHLSKTYACCSSGCADTDNDPLNCGACGTRCPSDKPVCLKSTTGQSSSCVVAACGDGIYPMPVCNGGASCCGRDCCQQSQVCCNLPGSIDHLGCWAPTAAEPSCPKNNGLSISDRNIKRAVVPVNPPDVLAKVIQLPISTWQYRSDPESVRHMGPMAQDLKQAFGLGDSDRWYHSVDGHGIALASIQALANLTAEQKQHLELLERQNRILERRLRALENR